MTIIIGRYLNPCHSLLQRWLQSFPSFYYPLQLDFAVPLKWGFILSHALHEDEAYNLLWAIECSPSDDVPVLSLGLKKWCTVLFFSSESYCNHVKSLRETAGWRYRAPSSLSCQLIINMREAILDQYSANWPQMPWMSPAEISWGSFTSEELPNWLTDSWVI